MSSTERPYRDHAVIDRSAAYTFDLRVLRPSIGEFLRAWVRASVGHALITCLTAVVFGVAFWYGAVAGMGTSAGVTSDVSLTAARYVAEVAPFLLAAALPLVVFRWGVDWLFPCLVIAAGVLGFLRPRLPPPTGILQLPEVARDRVTGFFSWGADHPFLQLVGLAMLAVLSARRSYAAMGWGTQRRSGTTPRHRPWSPTSAFENRLRRAALLRTVLAALHVAVVQISLLWSLLILRSAVDGSWLIDQRTLEVVASGVAAYTPVLLATTAVMCHPGGTGDLRILRYSLLLTILFGATSRPLGGLSWSGPAWAGDMAADLTGRLLDISCWAGAAGVGISLVILQATRRIFGWR